jgi:cysteine desulfurase family protein (TIGR01976 family)
MLRERFPGLHDGWARLDGPAGTQVVDTAIEAMADWMRSGDSANHGGRFRAAERTDELVARTRATCGRLLGGDPRGVVFGASMTALTYRFTTALSATWGAGDEVVCTRLDHDANVAPWLAAAERAGATVRFADPEPETLQLPAAAVEAVLSDRTRAIAVTGASNACGVIPDLHGIAALAQQTGARLYVDAVHAAPHRPLDATALGADAMVCSAYKWFGPHVGVLWARPDLLEELHPDKLRPSPEEVPDRFERGTLPFEALAGVDAAARFLLDELDRDGLRRYEDGLLARMLDGLGAIDGVTVHGDAPQRTSTVMFTVEGHPSDTVAEHLAREHEVAVWGGNYYAYELFRHLALEPHGAVRAGTVAYNEASDVDRLLEGVAELAASASPASSGATGSTS